VTLDALSWIALIVLALIALAVATSWLLTPREYGDHGEWFRYAGGTLGGLLLAGVLLAWVEIFANVGIKEAVFDGWLDSVADSIDGTNDREEWLAKHREGSGRGSYAVNAWKDPFPPT
jgi:hypothetical protein